MALTLPERLDPGDSRLLFAGENLVTGETVSEVAQLQVQGAGQPLLRIDPADLDGLRIAQATIARWKAEDDASGSLGIALGLCRDGAGPAPDATVSVAIRAEEGGDYLPLVRNGPISSVADVAEIAQLLACP